MSGFEWFLAIVVVILIPLVIAVVVTLWTLEMARRRNPRNRPGGKVSGTKRKAVREPSDVAEGDDRTRHDAGETPEPPERA